jgi:hypothetical protein
MRESRQRPPFVHLKWFAPRPRKTRLRAAVAGGGFLQGPRLRRFLPRKTPTPDHGLATTARPTHLAATPRPGASKRPRVLVRQAAPRRRQPVHFRAGRRKRQDGPPEAPEAGPSWCNTGLRRRFGTFLERGGPFAPWRCRVAGTSGLDLARFLSSRSVLAVFDGILHFFNDFPLGFGHYPAASRLFLVFPGPQPGGLAQQRSKIEVFARVLPLF